MTLEGSVQDSEAVKLATTVADLWPHPPMSDMRRTFYAKALGAAIPTFEDGLRAVDALFLTERYAPTPGDVIDRALSIGPSLDREWTELMCMATAMQSRASYEASSLGPEALRMLRVIIPGGFLSVPLHDQHSLERYRAQYVKRRGEQLRSQAAGRLGLAEG